MRSIWILLVASVLAACGSSSDSDTDPNDPAATDKPWQTTLLLGNFEVNTAPVTTYQDGVSLAYIADSVPVSNLPNADFEYFSVNAYVPTSDSVYTQVNQPAAFVSTVNGTKSEDIYWSGGFLQQTTHGGQLYSVYNLQAHYTGSTPINQTNFANVFFEFQLVYLNGSDDSVLSERSMTLEVYKQ